MSAGDRALAPAGKGLEQNPSGWIGIFECDLVVITDPDTYLVFQAYGVHVAWKKLSKGSVAILLQGSSRFDSVQVGKALTGLRVNEHSKRCGA